MRLRIAVLVHERNEGVGRRTKMALAAEDGVGGIACEMQDFVSLL